MSLNGYAMMAVHREEEIDMQMVISDLAKLGGRHLNFCTEVGSRTMAWPA
jgi:hypothetical protein